MENFHYQGRLGTPVCQLFMLTLVTIVTQRKLRIFLYSLSTNKTKIYGFLRKARILYYNWQSHIRLIPNRKSTKFTRKCFRISLAQVFTYGAKKLPMYGRCRKLGKFSVPQVDSNPNSQILYDIILEYSNSARLYSMDYLKILAYGLSSLLRCLFPVLYRRVLQSLVKLE